MQEVPISVTAFTGAELRDLKIATLVDMAAHTPRLNIKNQFGGEGFIFTIRGIGTNDASTVNSPTVSVYVDEVLVPYHMMLGFNLFDMERTEVLKGPQGTLYGRNNTGGAISFVTQKPTQETTGFVRADYSTFKTLEIEAALGGRARAAARPLPNWLPCQPARATCSRPCETGLGLSAVGEVRARSAHLSISISSERG